MRNPITGEPILFAPDRAGRPNAFGEGGTDTCPFCPGNESLTPPAIEVIGDPWQMRVFRNKYPCVEGHEVIVESRRHEDETHTLLHADAVVEMWARRYRAHAAAASYVSIFKNAGARAGASIDHAHSQLIPLTFVPPRVANELAGFLRHCPLCEPPRPAVMIRENQSWIAFAPEGPSFAYQQWIAPKEHLPDISHTDLESLASILQAAAAATRRIASSYNIMLMNFPPDSGGHFYIDVIPRMTAIAGFELATGTFIDIIDPAVAARALR